ILAKGAGATDKATAAAFIRRNLTVEPGKKSNIILIRFQHPNPEICVQVLTQLIEAYFKKHVEVHRGIGALDGALNQQPDQVRARLAETEKELKEVMAGAGVISVEDTKKAYWEQVNRIQQDLLTTQSELAQRRAILIEVAKMGTNSAGANATNAVAAITL